MSRDLKVRAFSLYTAARRTRAWRAVSWYQHARGSILCGGLAYTALFSLFAALTIGYSVLTQLLGGRDDIIEAILKEVDEMIPGLIDMGSSTGGILKPKDLISGGALSTGLSLTSVVAAGVLVFTVIRFMSALRKSVRLMFDRRNDEENPVRVFLRELVVFFVILFSLVVAAAAMVVESQFSPVILGWIGLESVSVVSATVVGVTATVVVNSWVVAVIVRMLADIKVKRSDLLWGCVAAGVAMAGLRYLGSSFITASASRNALLAPFATMIALLLLVNFSARAVLMSCAWIADPPATSRYELPPGPDEWEIRRGWGSSWPWSPIVRGYRRGRYPRSPL